MWGNYDKDAVKNIILNEGLLYAVTNYMDEEPISDSLPVLKKKWKEAREKIQKLQDLLNEIGFEPAILIHDEGEYKIIVDPPYTEFSIKDMPTTKKYVDEIHKTLMQIITAVGLNEKDYDKKFKKGGLTKKKARMILHEGKAHGRPISEQQRKFFGARASGYPEKKALGGLIDFGFLTQKVSFTDLFKT